MTTGRINQVAVTRAAAAVLAYYRSSALRRPRRRRTARREPRRIPTTAERRHDDGTSQRGRNRPACFCSRSLCGNSVGNVSRRGARSSTRFEARQASGTARRNFPLAFGCPLAGSESTRLSRVVRKLHRSATFQFRASTARARRALLLPRLTGWTIADGSSWANPIEAAAVSYLGRATVSDCQAQRAARRSNHMNVSRPKSTFAL